MKNLAQRLIFSADCSQSMGLTPELKIRRFENLFLFFFFLQDQAKIKGSTPQNPPSKIHPRYLRGTLCTRIQYMGGRVEQRIHPPPKTWYDAWKKLRKERNFFSKLLIFSTDCSQSMGLQSVIKIRGKTSKLFALHASPYKGTVFTSDPECLRKERPAAVFNFKKKQIIVFRAWFS